jgi:steroid 5-alpha reductase family enzyme
MNKEDWKALIISDIVVIIAAALAFAISWPYINNVGNSRLPLYAFAVILSFGINWIAFIPSFIKKTEKYYDLVGSITYSSVIILTFILSGNLQEIRPRNIVILVLVLIWTLRLGIFLFRRILKSGEDNRFTELKQSGPRFFRAWTLQGLWVSLTLAAALTSITGDTETLAEYNPYDYIMFFVGLAVWIIGFTFEAIGDRQKKEFLAKPENQGKFIRGGLWDLSRHPNYFGEFTLWVGMALISLPTMDGWRFFGLISPVFVYLLLNYVSGVPLNEDYADNKWGGQEDYEEYKKNTPVFFPKLSSKK